MSHTQGPYRDVSPSSPPRVIARRGNAALGVHLVLAVLGLLTPFAAARWGDRTPALFVLALVACPTGLFALGRTVHAFWLPHRIELDELGMRFVWADKVTALPWLARRDRSVAWSSLRGIQTHTVSVNGLATTTLVVTTDEGGFEVPDDRFDRGAYLVQREILDHLDRTRERPVGLGSAFAQRCRERYATALVMRTSPWPLIGAGAFFCALVGAMVAMAILVPFWLTYALAAVPAASFGALMFYGTRAWWRTRVLVLRADGIAIGPNELRARLIPWDDVRTVRRERTNGKTDAIEIVQESGERTSLRFAYPMGHDALARAIDPAAITPG
jgi:hypothetical protein